MENLQVSLESLETRQQKLQKLLTGAQTTTTTAHALLIEGKTPDQLSLVLPEDLNFHEKDGLDKIDAKVRLGELAQINNEINIPTFTQALNRVELQVKIEKTRELVEKGYLTQQDLLDAQALLDSATHPSISNEIATHNQQVIDLVPSQPSLEVSAKQVPPAEKVEIESTDSIIIEASGNARKIAEIIMTTLTSQTPITAGDLALEVYGEDTRNNRNRLRATISTLRYRYSKAGFDLVNPREDTLGRTGYLLSEKVKEQDPARNPTEFIGLLPEGPEIISTNKNAIDVLNMLIKRIKNGRSREVSHKALIRKLGIEDSPENIEELGQALYDLSVALDGSPMSIKSRIKTLNGEITHSYSLVEAEKTEEDHLNADNFQDVAPQTQLAEEVESTFDIIEKPSDLVAETEEAIDINEDDISIIKCWVKNRAGTHIRFPNGESMVFELTKELKSRMNNDTATKDYNGKTKERRQEADERFSAIYRKYIEDDTYAHPDAEVDELVIAMMILNDQMGGYLQTFLEANLKTIKDISSYERPRFEVHRYANTLHVWDAPQAMQDAINARHKVLEKARKSNTTTSGNKDETQPESATTHEININATLPDANPVSPVSTGVIAEEKSVTTSIEKIASTPTQFHVDTLEDAWALQQRFPNLDDIGPLLFDQVATQIDKKFLSAEEGERMFGIDKKHFPKGDFGVLNAIIAIQSASEERIGNPPLTQKESNALRNYFKVFNEYRLGVRKNRKVNDSVFSSATETESEIFPQVQTSTPDIRTLTETEIPSFETHFEHSKVTLATSDLQEGVMIDLVEQITEARGHLNTEKPKEKLLERVADAEERIKNILDNVLRELPTLSITENAVSDMKKRVSPGALSERQLFTYLAKKETFLYFQQKKVVIPEKLSKNSAPSLSLVDVVCAAFYGDLTKAKINLQSQHIKSLRSMVEAEIYTRRNTLKTNK